MTQVRKRIGRASRITNLAEERQSLLEQLHGFDGVTFLACQMRSTANRHGYATPIAARRVQAFSLLKARYGLLGVLAVLGCQPDVAYGRGHAIQIADRLPESEAFAKEGLRRGTVALQSSQHPRGVERLGSDLDGYPDAARQRPLEPLARLAEPAAQHPEAVQRSGQSQADDQLTAVVQRPVQRGAEVVVLALELVKGRGHRRPDEPLFGSLRKVGKIECVPSTSLDELASVGQGIDGEGADRLQQPEPRLVRRRVGDLNQILVGQPCQGAEDISRLLRLVGDQRRHGGHAKRSTEHAATAEHQLLSSIEQIVTPANRGTQAAVAGWQISRGSQDERLVSLESRQDHARRQDADLSRGKLDG